MNEPLLRCPWCGKVPKIDAGQEYFISCEDSDCNGYKYTDGEFGFTFPEFKTIKEAIAAWNTRTPPPASIQWPNEDVNVDISSKGLEKSAYQVGWADCLEACKELNAPNVTRIEVYGGLEGKPKTHMGTYIKNELCEHKTMLLGMKCKYCNHFEAAIDKPSEKKESDVEELATEILTWQASGMFGASINKLSEYLINAGWKKEG